MIASRSLKEHMIDTAVELLAEKADVDQITVRQIAERAGVSVGSVHYHFGSKNSLLAAAIEKSVLQMAESVLADAQAADAAPADQLKGMLKAVFSLEPNQEKLARFLLLQYITEGNLQTPLFVVRFLQDVCAEATESRLQILAWQIVQPLIVATIAPAAFRRYCGVDMYDEAARGRFIEELVDNVTIAP